MARADYNLERRKLKFIANAILVHGVWYDYSKIKYVNNTTKVHIFCPKHGYFEQLPKNHTGRKSACKLCAKDGLSAE